MQKTYYVTRLPGQVRRLDDLTLPWVDVSIAHDDGFLDVMSVPDAPEKVIVVGKAKGIYWSNDAGATWTSALGDYTTGLSGEFEEIWIVNDLISYVAGGTGGHVFKSVDGGVTFNILAAHPTPGGGPDGDTRTTAIHFINETTGIVANSIGGQTLIWKTTDGGASWVQLNGGNILGLAAAGGVHLSADEQNIVVQTIFGAWRSTDAGATFVQTLDLTVDQVSGTGQHLTWIDDSTMWIVGIGDTVRQSTDGGATWSVIRLYDSTSASILGSHFYDASNGFLGQTGSIHSTADAGANTTLSEAVAPPNAIWTGAVQDEPVEPCYILVDCTDENNTISTGVDLANQVGVVVSLVAEDGSEADGCWLVTESTEPCDPEVVQTVEVYKCYEDCDTCLPEPEPVPTPKPRAVTPDFETGLCDPHVVEKAFCEFGELMYKNMMSHRYKIAKCCPKDEDKILKEFHKIHLLLLETNDPTPDQCNPLCVQYGIDIQIADTAVISYTDCDEQLQELVVNATSEIQEIRFCGSDSSAPTAIVTHPDSSTDTFVLEQIRSCECITYRVIVESSTGGYIDYVDCAGVEQRRPFPITTEPREYELCTNQDSNIEVFGEDTVTIIEVGPCE